MTQATADQIAVTTVRMLSIDGVQAANSGHPGLPLGAAPMAHVLWTRFLRFDPHDPHWPNRDRFILSAGHGSMLIYSLLHLAGYDLSLDELKNFRQWGSKTPGHPERGMTPGVEVTTGPLGQGFANGVGMAIAEAYLAAHYNTPEHTLFDHYTYAIVSDGDLMEGVAAEAASLAGHLKLGKLIYLYDDNSISLDGETKAAFTEDVKARFAAYGWHTLTVEDGNDLDAIEQAIRAAQQDERPSLIAVQTIIGYGSPQQNTSKVHGSPLGDENMRKTKEYYGWEHPAFTVPDEARQVYREAAERGKAAHSAWRDLLESYAETSSSNADAIRTAFAGKLPDGWQAKLPSFTAADGELATRQASGKALKALQEAIPWLIGGSADLASSNEMPTNADISFQAGRYGNCNLWFGVREHAMGAIMNGIAGHGGTRAYGGTFLTFSDYMRGAIRLAALSELPVTYVFTHDSIGLGEDGPTHQPVEHVAALRAIPRLNVIRPADANETIAAWALAAESDKHPTALILSRQKLPVLEQTGALAHDGVAKGAYVVSEAEGGNPEVLLLATGSEVSLAIEAQEELAKEGVRARVVSMPCWELFAAQDTAYHDEILPPTVQARISIEAGVTQGWERWVGGQGVTLGVDDFGASAPFKEVYKHFGLTVEAVVRHALQLLGRSASAGSAGEQVPGSASGAEGHS